MKRWRIGIIGCGWAGQQHAQALQALAQRVELCAVVDTDIALAKAKAQEWQVPVWTSDYHQILDPAQLDAVTVCLPHDLHAPVSIEALNQGLHVLVEKPLANTLAEADAMIAAAAAANRRLMVAETVRFHQTYLKVVELLQSGLLGDLFMIRISREHEMHAYLRQRPWFLEQESAGIMVSGGIHDFEIVRMLGGDIEHVYGLVGRKVLPEMVADDTSVALAGLRSGVAAVISESFSLKTPRPGVHGAVHGSRGSLWFYNEQIQTYTASQDGRPDSVETITVEARNTFEAEIEHFLDCLDDGAEPITSGRDQRKPLAAVVATYESFKLGRRVYVD